MHFARHCIQVKMFGLFSVTSVEHLTAFSMQLLHKNSRLLVSQEKYFTGLKINFLIEGNVLYFRVFLLIGLTLKLVFLKVPSFDCS